jgi:medium-chain acyl-[acyl-carrier-protein] hydrolase
MISSLNPWFTCTHPKPAAKLKLFCFAYAGGGASVFRDWGHLLPAEIEVWAVQLPGRETRLRESAMTRLQPLVADISQAIAPHCDRPFALFGHSMGGLLSFEVARYVRRKYGISPVHLLVSGARAPQIPAPNPPIHALPQAEFLEELKQFNGTPIAVLQNVELMELLLPALRADFEIIETYIYTAEPPLSCPISAFGGTEDLKVCHNQLQAWEMHTNQFSLQYLPGDHFFLHSARSLLLNHIIAQLHHHTQQMFNVVA